MRDTCKNTKKYLNFAKELLAHGHIDKYEVTKEEIKLFWNKEHVEKIERRIYG